MVQDIEELNSSHSNTTSIRTISEIIPPRPAIQILPGPNHDIKDGSISLGSNSCSSNDTTHKKTIGDYECKSAPKRHAPSPKNNVIRFGRQPSFAERIKEVDKSDSSLEESESPTAISPKKSDTPIGFRKISP